jgi:RNA recognition motif-containing protein
MKRIYVGNLPYNASEDDIRALFAQYGAVQSVSIMIDRETGQPRGFGFVEMNEGANDAIAALDQKDYGGRNLRVNIARPREEGGPKRRW